jgi:WD40 repeat protein
MLDRAKQQIGRLVWTSDGKQLIVEGELEGRRLEVWDAEKFERTGVVEGLLDKGQRVSPDGRLVATRDTNKMQLWDLTQKNKILMTVEDPRVTWPPAWTADSQRMALKQGFDVQVLEMPSCKRLTTVHGLGGSQLLAWSGDGQALAGKIPQRVRNLVLVRVWAPEADRELATLFVGIEELLGGLAWSPQGHLLLGGTDYSLYLWDVKRSALRWRLVQLMGNKSVVIGEDGRILQADPGAEDELVYVVELPDGSLRLLTAGEFRAQHPPRE